MLNKEEIKVGDLVYYNNSACKIKKINKTSMVVCNQFNYTYGNVKFDDLVFKITNEEARKICLRNSLHSVIMLVERLERLRDIALEIGNLNDYIKYDTNQIEKDINDLINRVNKVLGDK